MYNLISFPNTIPEKSEGITTKRAIWKSMQEIKKVDKKYISEYLKFTFTATSDAHNGNINMRNRPISPLKKVIKISTIEIALIIDENVNALVLSKSWFCILSPY